MILYLPYVRRVVNRSYCRRIVNRSYCTPRYPFEGGLES